MFCGRLVLVPVAGRLSSSKKVWEAAWRRISAVSRYIWTVGSILDPDTSIWKLGSGWARWSWIGLSYSLASWDVPLHAGSDVRWSLVMLTLMLVSEVALMCPYRQKG